MCCVLLGSLSLSACGIDSKRCNSIVIWGMTYSPSLPHISKLGLVNPTAAVTHDTSSHKPKGIHGFGLFQTSQISKTGILRSVLDLADPLRNKNHELVPAPIAMSLIDLSLRGWVLLQAGT